MSFKRILARILILAVLEVGSIGGVPMTPEKIREILEMGNRTRVEHVIKTESGDGLPPDQLPRPWP